MGIKTLGTLVNPKDYPGVTFGKGVVIYGKVKIGKGTHIGDYVVLGIPTIDHAREHEPLSKTIIGEKVTIGPFCVINNGAMIGSKVEIEEYCKIGWDSKIGTETMIMYRSQIHWNVRIGKKCLIGGFCCDCAEIRDEVIMFGSLIHKYKNPLKRSYKDPISLWKSEGGKQPSPKIGKQSVIGFNSLVIGGIKLCSKSFICVNSIVTRDVKYPKVIVRGNAHLAKGEYRKKYDYKKK